jgi:hypothetical protein
MNPLTDRDANANDLRHLLTNPAPREDCSTSLVSPATASAHRGIFEKELIAEQTRILENYKKDQYETPSTGLRQIHEKTKLRQRSEEPVRPMKRSY